MQSVVNILVQAVLRETLDVGTYDAARIGVITYLEKRFGPQSRQLSYALSMSNPETTLRGTYNDQQRSVRMKDDLIALTTAFVSMVKAADEADGILEKQAKFDQTKVFLVHGHNTERLYQVKAFVEELGLLPIILHEQANRGRTLIEKFEEHSDVGFAIVLLTADDHGASRTTSKLRFRARQNVILELGYFFGKLGRNRTAVLFEAEIETPSDLLGVVYIPVDRPDWTDALKIELDSAGMHTRR